MLFLEFSFRENWSLPLVACWQLVAEGLWESVCHIIKGKMMSCVFMSDQIAKERLFATTFGRKIPARTKGQLVRWKWWWSWCKLDICWLKINANMIQEHRKETCIVWLSNIMLGLMERKQQVYAKDNQKMY